MLFGGDEASLNATALANAFCMGLFVAAANATGLRVFFGFLLMLVLSAGFYASGIGSSSSGIAQAKETPMRLPTCACGWSFLSGFTRS